MSREQDSVTLRPCPFCGGSVESYQQTSKVPDNWAVRCDVCGAQCGPSASSVAAKYNWNTRVAAHPQAASSTQAALNGWELRAHPDGSIEVSRDHHAFVITRNLPFDARIHDFLADLIASSTTPASGGVTAAHFWKATDEVNRRACASGGFNNIDEVVPAIWDRVGELSMSPNGDIPEMSARADTATRAPDVDDAMVERALCAKLPGAESLVWQFIYNGDPQAIMRTALEAALTAAQEGVE